MDKIINIQKAREFLYFLGGKSPADLTEESQRALVSIFYKKIKAKGGSHPVETAPKENVYRAAMERYEYSQDLSKEPLYHTFGELEKAIEKRDAVKIEELQERICIQLEAEPTKSRRKKNLSNLF